MKLFTSWKILRIFLMSTLLYILSLTLWNFSINFFFLLFLFFYLYIELLSFHLLLILLSHLFICNFFSFFSTLFKFSKNLKPELYNKLVNDFPYLYCRVFLLYLFIYFLIYMLVYFLFYLFVHSFIFIFLLHSL